MALSKVPDETPANDNEHPDEPWKRADLILQAYSGQDLNVADNQKTAVTQLLTDLMHYCEVMSMGKRSDHPDSLDFHELLDHAFANYEVQSHSMNHVIDMEVKRTVDLVAARLAEIKEQDIHNPTAEPDTDSEKDAAELEALLKALEQRQAKERENLDRSHQRSIEDSNNNPDVVAECAYLANAFKEHQHEETQHYVADFYKAREMREQLRLDAGSEKREQGIGQDGPTLSE